MEYKSIEAIKELLNGSQTSDEWRKNCNIVKGRFGDQYPEWWWKEIIQSGFADKILARWGSDTKLRIKVLIDGKMVEI